MDVHVENRIMIRKLLLYCMVMAVAGCASMRTAEVRYRPVFRYELVEVQRPPAAIERYGTHRIEAIQDSVARHRFEDQLVRVDIHPVHSRISLTLTNKTTSPIRIPWGDASYVSIEGESQPVMHGGEKYTECASRKPVSVVAAGASLADDVMPCGAVRATYATWFAEPLLPEMRIAAGDTSRIRSELQTTLVGKRFHLRLPLEVESVVNDYRFTFAIAGFDYRPVEF